MSEWAHLRGRGGWKAREESRERTEELGGKEQIVVS